MLLATAVLLAGLAQELVKDVEDMEGDHGFRKTLPIQIGSRKVFLVAALLLSAAMTFTVGFLLETTRHIALVASIPGILIGCLIIWKLLISAPEQATSLVRMMKIAMSILILVVILVPLT